MAHEIIVDVCTTSVFRDSLGFDEFFKGAAGAAGKYGYKLNVVDIDKITVEKYLQRKKGEKNLYVLVIGVNTILAEEIFKGLKRAAIPFIMANRGVPSLYGTNIVSVSFADAARDLTNHLIKGGRKRIAFLGFNSHSSPSINKLEGYRIALEENGIPFDCGNVFNHTDRPIMDAVRDFALKARLYDAVLCSTDAIAVVLLKSGCLKNIFIPGDLALVGFDDFVVGRLVKPRITTVRPFLGQVGEMSIRAIQLMQEEKNLRNTVLLTDYRINVRESCGIGSLQKKQTTEKPDSKREKQEGAAFPHNVSGGQGADDNIRSFDPDLDLDIVRVHSLEALFSRLKPIELKILVRMLEGYIYKDIAKEVFLSEVSIKYYVRRMKMGAGVGSAGELMEMIDKYLDTRHMTYGDIERALFG